MTHNLRTAGDELDADRLAHLMMGALEGMKALHGVYWPARATPFRKRIEATMDAEGCGVLEAAVVLVAKYKRLNWPTSMILAAAAEMATETAP